MKTKQIKGAVDILLVCGFPSLIHRPLVILKMLRNMRPEYKTEDWQFHCQLSEITEEQKEKLIKIHPDGYECWDYVLNDWGGFGFDPEDSVQSLLEANGVLKENPYEKPQEHFWQTNARYGDFPLTRLYDEAEANVFPPETTLVFIKQ